jgi:hypothetical protein
MLEGEAGQPTGVHQEVQDLSPGVGERIADAGASRADLWRRRVHAPCPGSGTQIVVNSPAR